MAFRPHKGTTGRKLQSDLAKQEPACEHTDNDTSTTQGTSVIAPNNNGGNSTSSTSTQTSFSIENLTVDNGDCGKKDFLLVEDSDSGRYTESSSSDAEICAVLRQPYYFSSPSNNLQFPRSSSVNEHEYERVGDHPSLLYEMANCSNKNDGSSLSRSVSQASTSSSISSYRDMYNRYRRRCYPTLPMNSSSNSDHSSSSCKGVKNWDSCANGIKSRNVFLPHKSCKIPPGPGRKWTSVGNAKNKLLKSRSNVRIADDKEESLGTQSNIQLEVILPMEELISAALKEGEKKHSDKTEGATTPPKNNNDFDHILHQHRFVKDLFTITTSTVGENKGLTSKIELRTRVRRRSPLETISCKNPVPSVLVSDNCRESEIL